MTHESTPPPNIDPAPGQTPSTSGPERTPDGHHIIVNGRKWRASDPSIPEKLRAELVAELMAARRLVRTDPEHARPRVQDAKVALGERGEAWWEHTDQGRSQRIVATIKALLRHRDGTTICPSDAAKVVGGTDWRELMDRTRNVAACLHRDGVVEVRQRGTRVDPTHAHGPLRIAPGTELGP